MGNVISVLHYGGKSISPEVSSYNNDDGQYASESDDESSISGDDAEKQNGGDDSENITDDVVIKGELSPKNERNEMSRDEEMEEFHKELAAKREARRRLISEKANELKSIQKQLTTERRIREKLLAENSLLKTLLAENKIDLPDLEVGKINNCTIVEDLQSNMSEMEETIIAVKQQNTRLRSELSESHSALQSTNSDNTSLNKEIFESRRQITALKEVVDVSKKMLAIRENQLMQLKEKLLEIEQSFADRETAILSEDLRLQYEKQLVNIRNLRVLYEERSRVAEVNRRSLIRQLEDQKQITSAEIDKNQALSNQIEELQKEILEKENTIFSKNDQLESYITETRGLQKEMAGINNFFTQMLLGSNQAQDLDKLVNRLEEHHDLLREMAVKEHCSDAASQLPKLLLDLVSQVENEQKISEDEDVQNQEDSTSSSGMRSHKEIVGNLPKVWRVLMELLSHQNSSSEEKQEDSEKPGSCYKSVQTPSGNVLVPSVSKTYIRLKDLILEKKSLQKEMGKMKQLNSHLENCLQDQERRLCLVSSELTKTWHVVGRLRRHHQQLHTHEKILRYELKQKRKLLTEIKEELEYCREKWDQARQKNDESEVQWKKLRTEFAGRKQKSYDDSVNTSAESGFSDDKQSDDEDSRSLDNCAKADKIGVTKKILENNHDSMTDINPMAEGEDPISDIIDVTDLPLDDQENESDDNSNTNEDILSESEDQPDGLDILVADTGPKVKSKVKHKLTNNVSKTTDDGLSNMETSQKNKDDNRPINNADPREETNNDNIPLTDSINMNGSQRLPRNNSDATSKLISPAEIMENIRLQNNRLFLRDQRMQRLEDGCNILTQQVTRANNRGELLTKRVDSLNDKSKLSLQKQSHNNQEGKNDKDAILNNKDKSTNESVDCSDKEIRNEQKIETLTTDDSDINVMKLLQKTDTNGTENERRQNNETEDYVGNASTSETTDSTSQVEILKNIKQHNEKLVESDCRILNTECESIIKTINVNEKADILNDQFTKANCDESKSCSDLQSDLQTELASIHQQGYVLSPAEILENVRKQNERLEKKDLKMKNVENECKDIIGGANITNEKADELDKKLDRIVTNQNGKNNDNTSKSDTECTEESAQESTNSQKASSSDYEARLIAKEERLKRLEDQAKSLVNKMNNTETKRVKIDFKLQELHNIYGVSEDQSTSNDSFENTELNENEGANDEVAVATDIGQISRQENE